eukprot:Gregarina_sp_Poly_1__3397@NODE_1984_length_2938_cov_32_688610_g1278_i0_p1_GENE_NODE_1984_length_2938_cov_32_688610_g1278_i0NODE_1984_length_2938_cov_32_688610_g1278_i0_p1_ORF_typecomplete_len124_score7_82AOC_like/PF18678_1/0_13_NODE_1984_length_2938_cov_32_688610_g1278_i019442315
MIWGGPFHVIHGPYSFAQEHYILIDWRRTLDGMQYDSHLQGELHPISSIKMPWTRSMKTFMELRRRLFYSAPTDGDFRRKCFETVKTPKGSDIHSVGFLEPLSPRIESNIRSSTSMRLMSRRL